MTVAVLLPDGVGVRNFVLGPFLDRLAARGPVLALHCIEGAELPRYRDGAPAAVSWEPLQRYRENPGAFLLRYLAGEAHMYHCGTRAMRYNLSRPIRGSWRTRMARVAARRLARVCATPRAIGAISNLGQRIAGSSPEIRHYREILARYGVHTLFCSHQRPPSILPVVLAARELGIRTGTFIFSWDNISTKARIAAPFDDYYVWSNLMRDELLTFYPEINSDQVHVVGTPQFDPYANGDLLWSRQEFCRRIGADHTRPMICYSGGDVGTCPEDPAHVRILLEEIRAGRITGSPQVLLRPMPVDDGQRYARLCADYPELIYLPPAWSKSASGDWAGFLPLPDDTQLLANLTAHSDVNVNVASTMTLDFAIHDRPVVNVAFDVASPPVLGEPMGDLYYSFEHYRPVVELGAVRVARSREQLAAGVNAYLSDPSADRAGRAALVALQVGSTLGTASSQLADVITSFNQLERPCTSAFSATSTRPAVTVVSVP